MLPLSRVAAMLPCPVRISMPSPSQGSVGTVTPRPNQQCQTTESKKTFILWTNNENDNKKYTN